MTTRLPFPPPGNTWAEMLITALHSWITHVMDRVSALEIRTTDAGRIQLTTANKAKIGELVCNGQLVSRTGQPILFRAIGTTFNTGGEAADKFRVPNIPAPLAGTEWRISTGS